MTSSGSGYVFSHHTGLTQLKNKAAFRALDLDTDPKFGASISPPIGADLSHLITGK